MKTIFLLTICFLAATTTNAQLPTLQWVNEMVGTNSKTLATDPSGNVYMLGNMGAGSTLDVDPGPGVYTLNGDDGTTIIYKLNTAGQFVWAKQLPDISPECIQADAAQNVYLVGYYVLTKDFDPGPGVFNLTTVSQNDIFILKLDPDGNFLWAKSQGGTQADLAYSVAISATGIVYTTGYFIGTSDFDPGAGVTNITSGIQGDTHVSALDANGNFLWVKQIPGGFNQAHSITTNALGNIVVAGEFSGTKDFDPGPGVFNLTATVGGADIYILKLDGLGNFVWAKSVGGPNSELDGAVALDPTGNVYATGRFALTGDFDPGPATFNLTSFGGTDIFVVKLNASGVFTWAKQMGGILNDAPLDITADASGNVLTTGIFNDVADFDPGVATFNLTTNGSNDIFISKLNTDGDFVWAVGFGSSTSEDRGNGISVDLAGNVYATGNFQGQVDFDPGPGVAILLHGNTSIFVLKFGPAGGPLPVTLINFSGTATKKGIALQWQTALEINTSHFEIEWSEDGLHFKKIASQNAAGNSTAISTYSYLHASPVNGENYYRLKMLDIDGRFTLSGIVKINTKLPSILVTAFPNPVINLLELNIRALKNETIVVYLHSADGKTISSKLLNVVKGSNRFQWNMQTVPPGRYFISTGNGQFKTIPIHKQ